MIVEGLVTTTNDDGSPHLAPMGPLVDDEITRLTLRPYQTSTTLKNLLCQRQGVFHITDDVELLARAAVGRLEKIPSLAAAQRVSGWILTDACRWFAFEVSNVDLSQPRTTLEATVVDRGHVRDFLGFNRAKNAVVEAAILATRISILPSEQILGELHRLAPLVDKTGGPAEQRAFEFLQDFIRQATSQAPHAAAGVLPADRPAAPSIR